jgi:hypothetical protein
LPRAAPAVGKAHGELLGEQFVELHALPRFMGALGERGELDPGRRPVQQAHAFGKALHVVCRF